MIYQPRAEYQLNKQEQQIYRRIIDRHRRYITEKYNLAKRYNSHIFQYKHRPKSRFYDEKRENMFANTLLNRSRTPSTKLTIAQLEQIPAEEFLQLCEKLEKMSINKKEPNKTQDQRLKSVIRKNKSICQMPMHRKNNGPRNYDSLEKSMKKLLPKLPKVGTITNRQFFELFMKKSKEAMKINCIKEQIQLQIEYENDSKVEAIMNARKTAKQFMVCFKLVDYFKKAIVEVIETGKKLCDVITDSLPRLEQQAMQQGQAMPEEQKSQFFSIKNINLERKTKRIIIFNQISNKVLQFNTRLQDYYEGEMLSSLPLREVRFFIDYFNTNIREISLQINNILTRICQQYFIPHEDSSAKKYDLPSEVTSITNSYAFNDFRQVFDEFMSYKHFITLFYEHLERVLHLKDLMCQADKKRSSTAATPKKLKAGVRVS